MIIKNQKDINFVASKFSAIQNKLLNKRSEAESKFASLLLDAGIWYRREKCHYQIDSRWSFYDFLIPALDLFIEIDGIEHLNPQNKEIDEIKSRQIQKRGHQIIRYTNDEVITMKTLSIDDMMERIKDSKRKHKSKALTKYKQRRVEDIVHSYIQQYDIFGDVINTPNIFLYDKEIGVIFKFRRLYDVNVATSIKTAKSIELLSKQYDKRQKRFILTNNESICRKNAKELFGDSNTRIVEWQFPNYEIPCIIKTVMSRDVIYEMTQVMEDGTISAFLPKN